MKTPEEIIRKYVFHEEWNFQEVVGKESAIKAMEEYAIEYHKQQVEGLSKPDEKVLPITHPEKVKDFWPERVKEN